MLTVYRASAGSGKTHLLTGTYLRMLFSENTTYENILAVTFTNKATDEMKQRIIEQLYVLSINPTESDYLKTLIDQFKLSEDSISQKARKILIEILHSFSSFNVSTIDRFFQQTTRSFTREIGLSGGYEIELDSTKVLGEAIDRMLSSLEQTENQTILNWLIMFANDRIENGKDWNSKKELLTLSKEILKEDYKRNSERIQEFTQDKTSLIGFIQELKQLKEEFEQELKEVVDKGVELIKSHDLNASDFSGGSRSSFNSFEKWRNGDTSAPTNTFRKLVDEVENWYTKKSNTQVVNQIETAYYGGLNDCVSEIVTLFDRFYTVYLSASESLRYIYTVGILGDIDRNVREYSREHNIMLISDTTELLNKIIDGKDNPFIYEKIGTHLRHFMIDEFQDTSGMQWGNFHPLISDSIAHDYNNLIVGDVKQSIYRWRSSDWMLLHHHLRAYVSDQRVDAILDTNWRSCKNIVDFNNAFFTIAANMLQDKYNATLDKSTEGLDETYRKVIRAAYDDIYQKLPEKKKDLAGHVRVEFIESEEDKEWDEIVLDRLPDTLISLQQKGYQLKDIALLVRNGKEGAKVAESLLAYKALHPDSAYRFDVISNEALYIANSPLIRLIIAFLNYLNNPQSEMNKTLAAFNLTLCHSDKDANEALSAYFGNDEAVHALYYEKIIAEAERLKKLPLFEMIEKIISLVIDRDNRSDRVYVQAFQDLVLDFTVSNSADLSAFLSWWNNTGNRKTISTPDSQDAIRILTIHKSKGLGFNAVIIPFASWEIDHKTKPETIIWCEPQSEPFSKIPLVPICYSSKLLNTIFAHNYLNEMRQTFIDNLNIAYVAFTRAKEELIIFAEKPVEKKSKSSDPYPKNISQLLFQSIQSKSTSQTEKPLVDLTASVNDEMTLFELGSWWQTTQKEKNGLEEITMSHYASVDPGNRLQLRLHGKGYFRDKQERLYGNLMHDILSGIKYPEDISGAVAKFVQNGNLKEEESFEVINKLQLLVDNPEVKDWFSKEAKVLNEIEILIPDGSFLRPDRVVLLNDKILVIDYKFGKIHRKSYIRQLLAYTKHFEAMGYEQVEGYLWYVELNEIEKIKGNS